MNERWNTIHPVSESLLITAEWISSADEWVTWKERTILNGLCTVVSFVFIVVFVYSRKVWIRKGVKMIEKKACCYGLNWFGNSHFLHCIFGMPAKKLKFYIHSANIEPLTNDLMCVHVFSLVVCWITASHNYWYFIKLVFIDALTAGNRHW